MRVNNNARARTHRRARKRGQDPNRQNPVFGLNFAIYGPRLASDTSDKGQPAPEPQKTKFGPLRHLSSLRPILRLVSTGSNLDPNRPDRVAPHPGDLFRGSSFRAPLEPSSPRVDSGRFSLFPLKSTSQRFRPPAPDFSASHFESLSVNFIHLALCNSDSGRLFRV